ncbi:MAG TPA: methyltransferase domain-containing protein [Lutibacter sp.]
MNYSFNNTNKIDHFLKFLGLSKIILLKNRIKTNINIKKYLKKDIRNLEIGPGLNRIEGFETLNVIDGFGVDYICDIAKPLPFRDDTFDLIYASHVIEHVPWYLQKKTFNELFRILKKDGVLEIWVPDGLKIVQTLYDYETNGINNIHKDGWYRFNEDKDVGIWANGRIFTYGDGEGNLNHPNWHRTLFTPRLLENMFRLSGFKKIKMLDNNEVRGVSHGWINLGIKGTK